LYSTAIDVSGGDTITKVLYFLMALEVAPLTWLEILKPNSIYSWGDLKKAFINNFQGSMHRVATRHDFSLCKQEQKESLRSYVRCFFNTHATIANISDEDVIDCFHKASQHKASITILDAIALRQLSSSMI